MNTGAPMCYDCKHLREVQPGEQDKCAAFPDGIPFEIINNEKSHFIPILGDGGVFWEPKGDVVEIQPWWPKDGFDADGE